MFGWFLVIYGIIVLVDFGKIWMNMVENSF